MRKTIVICVLLCVTIFGTFADTDEDQIRYLLQITNASNIGIMVLDSMLAQFEEAFPDVPEDFWQLVRDEISPEELDELIIPLYQRHLNSEDIIGLISFYESDLGTKLLKVQPVLIQESMVLGQQWGAEISMKVLMRMVEHGYNIDS